MRYIVISFGCLECANHGDDMAEVVLLTNDLEEAMASAKTEPYPGQEARILLDKETDEILYSKK